MFSSLSDQLAATFKGLRGRGRLSEADVEATLANIRVALLDADVALPVVDGFTAAVRTRAIGEEVRGSLNPAQQVVRIVHEQLVEILGGQARRLRYAKTAPTVIMLLGLQGAGKTTLAGKLARRLADEGHTPVLVAADLQRPNAVDQLRTVAGQAGVPVFAPEPGNGVGNPVDVARRSLGYARDNVHDVVIVDTAGRLAIDAALTREAAEIRSAIDPDEVLLVVDAMIGQDAVAVATAFSESVGFDGIVLTKLDGDARGGAALSLVGVTGLPIMFASVGERLTDLEVFHPDRMASRILDMGDILTLIEQAERAFDADQAARYARRLASGEDFTLEDFLEQLQSLKSMGSMGALLKMMPGGAQARAQIEGMDERDLIRMEAVIRSMTPGERADPRILDGRRRARVARGAGVQVSFVNQLLTRFGHAQKLMRRAAARGGAGALAEAGLPLGPGMPPGALGGLHGGQSSRGGGRPAKKGKGSKGRSGNPAKRAASERPGGKPEPAPPTPVPGSGFGRRGG